MAIRRGNKLAVKITANFERNLDEIERFLTDADATQFFDALLDELSSTVIPNIERFPKMGRNFMDRPARSIEGSNGLDTLRKKLGEGKLREYVLSDFLLLYAQYGQTAYLLSIKHHRQLSFDFAHLWVVGQAHLDDRFEDRGGHK